MSGNNPILLSQTYQSAPYLFHFLISQQTLKQNYVIKIINQKRKAYEVGFAGSYYQYWKTHRKVA